jgi:hypothetical protein
VLRRQYEQVWLTDDWQAVVEHGALEHVECTAHWTRRAMRRLKANKAAVPDDISPCLLRKMSDALALAVALLISRSVQTGTVPTA